METLTRVTPKENQSVTDSPKTYPTGSEAKATSEDTFKNTGIPGKNESTPPGSEFERKDPVGMITEIGTIEDGIAKHWGFDLSKSYAVGLEIDEYGVQRTAGYSREVLESIAAATSREIVRVLKELESSKGQGRMGAKIRRRVAQLEAGKERE